jgi:hypothetical protein
MNMLIFNFHKIMDMHKGYAYQFSDFITYEKPRIAVCVVFSYYALKESSDVLQSAKCKVQSTNTWLCSRFANPNS